MLHDVRQRKVHNSWLQTGLGTVGEHLQHAMDPAQLARGPSCRAGPAAALAHAPAPGNGRSPVLTRRPVVPGGTRGVAVAGSRERLPPGFLCSGWWSQVCYLSCGGLHWSGF